MSSVMPVTRVGAILRVSGSGSTWWTGATTVILAPCPGHRPPAPDAPVVGVVHARRIVGIVGDGREMLTQRLDGRRHEYIERFNRHVHVIGADAHLTAVGHAAQRDCCAASTMSASRDTITGFLPPSSRVTGTRLAAAAAWMRLPTPGEPVKKR